jgi:hypothetical protein
MKGRNCVDTVSDSAVKNGRRDSREAAVRHIPRNAQISKHFSTVSFPDRKIKALIAEFRVFRVDFWAQRGRPLNDMGNTPRKATHTSSFPGFVVPESYGASWEARRGHKEPFPHLLKIQQPVGSPPVK